MLDQYWINIASMTINIAGEKVVWPVCSQLLIMLLTNEQKVVSPTLGKTRCKHKANVMNDAIHEKVRFLFNMFTYTQEL